MPRARRALHQRNVGSKAQMALPRPQLQDLLDRYVTLWEQADTHISQCIDLLLLF